MSFKINPVIRMLIAGTALSLVGMTGPVIAAPAGGANVRADPVRVAEHWTSERRRNAIPRDLVIDSRGLGYLRGSGGSLEPYGHDVSPLAKPVRSPRRGRWW